jgi:hypothetical protein
LVYFWLLIPKVAGDKIYSSPPVRGSRNNQHIQGSSRILHIYGRGTFFTVAASLEYAGRQRGGNGLFGWWLKISGIVNASYNMNQVVRNTSWVPGHFHLTVGSAVFLTFLGLSLYLLNKLFGKKVFSNTLSVLGAYMWLICVLIFS